ncbi:MAG: helix-turn-helix domain-containing protein [Planctomycetes bacterium]|nr:helix-turn-helix domain-containing protein [Planctomycetota bacterium]
MANGELIDAREAMDLLGIGENDLQTFVARGDLRAFRSAGTMKFRRDDVLSLKSEKGTEPTIIIPAATGRKPGQSGILSAVSAGPAGSGIGPAAMGARQGSGIAQPIRKGSGINPPVKQADATGEIVFDDIELLPTDDGMQTQAGTVVASAIQEPVGGAAATGEMTVVEGAAQTGEMTVVEGAADEAQVSTGPAMPVKTSGSGRRAAAPAQQIGSRVGSGVMPQPNVSRVRQSSVAVARRTATVYQQKTSHPIMTTILILNSAVMLFTMSVFMVMSFKGSYDKDSGQRVIPPFISDMYNSCYDGTMFGALPGRPLDEKPEGEPAGRPQQSGGDAPAPK